jgi:hypothetical protein
MALNAQGRYSQGFALLSQHHHHMQLSAAGQMFPPGGTPVIGALGKNIGRLLQAYPFGFKKGIIYILKYSGVKMHFLFALFRFSYAENPGPE